MSRDHINDHADHYPPRPWIQNNIKKLYLLSILLLAPLWAWSSWQIFTSQAQQQLKLQITTDMNLFADSLASELEKYRFVPKMLTIDAILSSTLNNANQSDHHRINSHIAYIRDVTAADEVFLLNPAGDTIASTKSENVGINYTSSTFFQASATGRSGGLFTLGVNTGTRGYYFSEPVFDKNTNQIIGVIVVKVNMARLERGWLNQRTRFMITDEFGIVIASSVPTWLFTSRQALNDSSKKAIADTGRYPTVSFPQLQIKQLSVSNEQPFAAQVISLPKADYSKMLEMSMTLAQANWQLYGHGNLQALDPIIRRNTLLSLLVLLLSLSLIYTAMQRRLQLKETLMRREINQRRLQNAKDLLEHRVAERTKALQDSNTELKQTQKELIHAAKLATLGQMATSLTHEVNQPLTAIQTCADNAEQWLTKSDIKKAQYNLKKINKLTQKMASIINNLRTFGQKADNTSSWILVSEAINNAIDLVHLRCKQEHVTLHIEDVEGIHVAVNLVWLEQVLINLLINALDAMLTCETKHLYMICERQQTHVVLKVRDTGPGIDPEHLEQIFDPFFTTKSAGEGLGLGLSISYSMVNSMGGELSALNLKDNTTGTIQGAEFSLRFPARYS